MSNELEYTIIANILFNYEFAVKVIPYLKKEYFFECGEIADEISKFFVTYTAVPTKKELIIEIQNRKGILPKRAKELTNVIEQMTKPDTNDIWMLSKTEKYFQERAITNAVMEGADIMESHPKDSGKIIDLVKDAMSVSFDNSIGLDYFKDVDRRYEMYHTVEDKVSWGIKALDNISGGGISKKNLVCAVAPTGCHSKGTKILTINGNFKNVEDVRIGDTLIGYKGQNRKVLRLIRGKEDMYSITPNNRKGKPFVVNGHHILALHNTITKKIDCISVIEYLNKSAYFKHIHHLYLNDSPMEFADNGVDLKVDPYFMGMYLGDGSTYGVQVTTMDEEIVDYIKDYLKNHYEKMYLSENRKANDRAASYRLSYVKKKKNPISKDFEEYGIIIGNYNNRTTCENKFIPEAYLTSGVENRLQLLAGLLDTDGYLNEGSSYFQFCSKSKRLVEDFCRLGRSLGFVCTIKERLNKNNNKTYYYASLMGNTSIIPTKIPRKRSNFVQSRNRDDHFCGFTIESVGEQDFYGFELDGDHLYYSDDFILQHNSGKSLFMCSIASNVLRQGQNVLYITMEMSENRVAERIDANLYGEPIDALKTMEEEKYKSKAEELRKRSLGRLIIREYPTSGANTNHFRNLLNELKNKQSFVPDLIVVDYLNICSSARYTPSQTNSYGFIKAISEELRGLAVEYNCAVLTATQTNRQGINNSDIEMTEVSESIATAFILDMFFAIIRTDTLDEQSQIMIKQLKNRYGDLTKNQSFCLGVDRDRMTVYDLDSSFNFNNPANYSSPMPRSIKNNGGLDLGKINC